MKSYDEKYPIWRHSLPKASLDHARAKYKTTGSPLPYPGYSVIHDIDAAASRELGVAHLAESVEQRVRAIGLWERFAFVSLESVHVTTFDLVNKPEYEATVGGRFLYDDVRRKVTDVAIEWLERNFSDLRGKARICGVGVFEQAGVLKLDLEFDSGTEDRFRQFRLALHSHLCRACEIGYTLYRDPAWDKRLSPHITVAYLLHPLSQEEADSLVGALKLMNDAFPAVEFEFSTGEVMYFSNMDNYSRV